MSSFLLLSLVGLLVRPDSTDSVLKRLQKGTEYAYVIHDSSTYIQTAVTPNGVCIYLQETGNRGKSVIRVVQHRIFEPGNTKKLLNRYRKVLPTLLSDRALATALAQRLRDILKSDDLYNGKVELSLLGYKRISIHASDDGFLQTLVIEIWK